MALPVEPVLDNPDLLARYAQIWRQSRRMQAAAREGDWELLIELEQGRAALNSALMRDERSGNGSAADRSAKAELIRNILASDVETRLLVVPRQYELQSTFDSIDTEKRLHKAYDMIG